MLKLSFAHILPNCSTSELVFVKGGIFRMGGIASWEKPLHLVKVSSFFIGKYPVTQELWEFIMGNNPSLFCGHSRPVEQVSWEDTQEFFSMLNKSIRLKKGQKFRLPSEAEWEYAASGGERSNSYYFSGGNKLSELGWYSENSLNETKPVGLKLSNELGIFDMSGNVWEWCDDKWSGNYQKNALKNGSSKFDEKKSAYRVLRGGSWDDYPQSCRPTCRFNDHPQFMNHNVGFRVVLFLNE